MERIHRAYSHAVSIFAANTWLRYNVCHISLPIVAGPVRLVYVFASVKFVVSLSQINDARLTILALIHTGIYDMKLTFLITAAVCIGLAFPAISGDTTRPDEAEVYFINVADGDTVSVPFKVIFGLSGMGVAPAGTETENTGHHHLLIDRPPLGSGEDGTQELDYGLPADAQHIHFGGGQTETILDLPPGKHTLQLVFGDLNHVPHATPVVSEMISIIVK